MSVNKSALMSALSYANFQEGDTLFDLYNSYILTPSGLEIKGMVEDNYSDEYLKKILYFKGLQ